MKLYWYFQKKISETHLKLYMKFYRMKFSLSVLYLTIHRYIVMFFAHLSSSDSLMRTYRHAWCLHKWEGFIELQGNLKHIILAMQGKQWFRTMEWNVPLSRYQDDETITQSCMNDLVHVSWPWTMHAVPLYMYETNISIIFMMCNRRKCLFCK